MTWKLARRCELGESINANGRRLIDLALAMVIPWPDGFPRYWLDETNYAQRGDEILKATEKERLPWL